MITIKRSDIRRVEEPDPWPDTSYLEQEGFEDRKHAYEEEAFYLLGIRAEVEVVVNNVVQKFQSGGLWGIESDSEPAFLEETFLEEVAALEALLNVLGIRVV